MLAVRRRALTGSSRALLLARRPYATTPDKPDSHHDHGHHDHGHHDAHHGPVSESYSPSFYYALAATVGLIGAYNLEQRLSGSSSNALERAIGYYADLSSEWEQRNARHTAMVERAAADRSLFHDSRGSKMIALKFPEALNAGSPYNQQVGFVANELTALRAHLHSAAAAREGK